MLKNKGKYFPLFFKNQHIMSNRRFFLTQSITGAAALGLYPYAKALSVKSNRLSYKISNNIKIRFALASDGHYGQEHTNSQENYKNLVNWINEEHDKKDLDFIIINGDIVHDRPDLLAEIKEKYFQKFKIPFYAVPGNHDFADTALWKSLFGYADNYRFEHQDVAFVVASTSNSKGEILCPDNVFLKEQLENFKNKKIVFVVLHIPPFKWLKEDLYNANCEETMRLLTSYANVKAVFHGHDHAIDGVRYYKKLPHFFDGHFGGNWGTNYKGYRIVEVTNDNKISTYQVNASKNPILNKNEFK